MVNLSSSEPTSGRLKDLARLIELLELALHPLEFFLTFGDLLAQLVRFAEHHFNGGSLLPGLAPGGLCRRRRSGLRLLLCGHDFPPSDSRVVSCGLVLM